MHSGLLDGPCELELDDGRRLRLLSAMEVLQARREAQQLAKDGREQALCSNACLLARALVWDGTPLFPDGEQVLAQMTAEEIGVLSERWARFNEQVNPGPGVRENRLDELKNVWSTPRKSGCTGACCDPFQPCPQNIASER